MVAEGDEGGEDLRLAFLESWITLKLPSGKDTKGTASKKLLATEAAAPPTAGRWREGACRRVPLPSFAKEITC